MDETLGPKVPSQHTFPHKITTLPPGPTFSDGRPGHRPHPASLPCLSYPICLTEVFTGTAPPLHGHSPLAPASCHHPLTHWPWVLSVPHILPASNTHFPSMGGCLHHHTPWVLLYITLITLLPLLGHAGSHLFQFFYSCGTPSAHSGHTSLLPMLFAHCCPPNHSRLSLHRVPTSTALALHATYPAQYYHGTSLPHLTCASLHHTSRVAHTLCLFLLRRTGLRRFKFPTPPATPTGTPGPHTCPTPPPAPSIPLGRTPTPITDPLRTSTSGPFPHACPSCPPPRTPGTQKKTPLLGGPFSGHSSGAHLYAHYQEFSTRTRTGINT